ncbi:sulfatase family protein [Novipirellula artificiosorum]|uniref:Arylsulfatase n=1 Tax=Novipirellula artificiosorum TaxID=2528016 RepID=A0A5C6DWU8_9BACT|nr:sulfatase [Novipirellula artificiosorum]TWU41128.1 Arylsulfatase [Novipirellula artificiosorum]
MSRFYVLSLFATLICGQLHGGDPAAPNVVVIFIDDMGYADINPFGGTDYPTPHLDSMAAEGRKFTDFVVSSAVCSASRSALMTGCYHRRIGIAGALGPKSEIGINPDETTIAEICKSKGYATAIFGKWHLGHHPKFLPTNHGFDLYYGIPYSNDMWPLHPDFLSKRKKNPDAKSPWPALPMISATRGGGYEIVNPNIQPADQEQMTKQFTERAVEFIKSNADHPFFLYLPHPMVHVPLYVSEDFRGKSGAGLFGDVVMEVDWSVGQVMKAIEEIGADEKTLVIFTSDNGPWLSYGAHAGKATPLREGKGTMFEGGYREPTLMRWKGKIPAGTTCDKLCSTIDILPTVAKLIDADLPSRKLDGRDIRPLMFGEAGAASPHDAFWCYYKGGELEAVRNERFKLMFPHGYRSLNGREGGSGGFPVGYETNKIQLSLFDLDADVSETKDVKDQYPEVVAKLMAAAAQAREELGDRLTDQGGSERREPGKLDPEDERLPMDWDS